MAKKFSIILKKGKPNTKDHMVIKWGLEILKNLLISYGLALSNLLKPEFLLIIEIWLHKNYYF